MITKPVVISEEIDTEPQGDGSFFEVYVRAKMIVPAELVIEEDK